ncbi:hypothetical protein [Nisaea denitrificans]|uniref:hypothetical protein n=1 Tax=Nisaea denitrificans TaxID=390877 RepID=UPI00041DA0E2|nr:hypothetical protein [Nisaea denitrificans]
MADTDVFGEVRDNAGPSGGGAKADAVKADTAKADTAKGGGAKGGGAKDGGEKDGRTKDDGAKDEGGHSDPMTPDYLVPRMRQYQVGETVQYQTAHLVGHFPDVKTNDIEEALDPFLEKAVIHAGGKPLEGVLLTHRQAWQQHGLAMGELLHSICLAPGEATRIAVVDWRRQARSIGSEDIEESDLLAREDEQNRSVSEIQQAVARETQTGQTRTRIKSASKQSGGSSSFFGLSGSSSSRSSMTADVSSVSFSAGQRDLSSEASQKVHQRTRELAEAARSRRATAVREIDEREGETASTRVVANYNHMHAMTVMYFEVLQVFEIETKVSQAERILFLPMKMIEFTPTEIGKHREALVDIAVDFGFDDLRVALLCVNWGTDSIGKDASEIGELEEKEVLEQIKEIQNKLNHLSDELKSINEDLKNKEKEKEEISDNINIVGSKIAEAKKKGNLGNFGELLKEFERLKYDNKNVEKAEKNLSAEKLNKRRSVVDLTQKIENLQNALSALRQNRLTKGLSLKRQFFSQQLWLRMGAHQVQGLIQDRTYDGRSLFGWMDPEPVAVFGNYVGFRLPFTDAESEGEGKSAKELFRKDFLAADDSKIRTKVALPSGGVFAEAVLGEANSAEEIDLGRFWNWSESPIPISPPGISDVSTGSRAAMGEAQPGQLSDPAVQLQGRAAMPDPTSGLIQALAAGQLFRDMSGLAGGQQAAGDAGRETGRGASDAAGRANEASANFLNYMKTIVESGTKLLSTSNTTVLGGLIKSLGVGTLGSGEKDKRPDTGAGDA